MALTQEALLFSKGFLRLSVMDVPNLPSPPGQVIYPLL